MALPEGIETCTVTSGVPVTFGGAPVKAFVSVEPSVYLVHTATGTPLVDFLEEQSVTEGVAAQFTLPVDQDGFQDENGNAYRGWFYTARITYSTTSKAKNKTPKVKVFQLVSGQTLVDLDTLPGGVAALPYTGPVAGVTSVNGQTGAVLVDAEPLPARLEEAALNATFARSLTKQTIAFLGDSQVPATTYVHGAAPHWAGVARAMLGHRYADGVMAGIGGQTSTQIAARVSTVTASQPSICVFDSGVNDLAAGVPASTIIANIQTIIDALVKAGIKPVVLTALPSVNINTPAKLTECTKLNDWIKALPSTQGVNAIDWRPGAVDFASTTAGWKAGLSSDAIHPNDVGHTVLGRIVAAGLAPLINAPSPLLSDAGINNSLLSLNPGMTGSGGTAGVGVTGTVPASWTVSPNGTTTTTASVEARTDDVGGNWLKLDITAGSCWVFQQNTAAAVDWNVGDTVWAEVELYFKDAPVNFRGAQIALDFWNGLGGGSDFTLMQAPGVAAPLPGSESKYVLRTKKSVIPVGTGRLQMFLYLNAAGVPNYTVRVGRLAIRRQI